MRGVFLFSILYVKLYLVLYVIVLGPSFTEIYIKIK